MLSLIAFLPGFARMPTIDRDEARFAQATKQMIASGDFVDIRFQNEVRYKKPVGIYWMQAAAVKASTLLGRKQAETRISAYRLPSLFGAIGAVLLTYWTALTFVSRRASVVAAVMMAACVLLGVEARLAKTDAVLLFTVVAAMGAMARVYLDRLDGWSGWQRQWLLPLIFWGALALGVLVKGPLILLIVGLPALTLCIVDRSARWLVGLKPLIGVPVFLAAGAAVVPRDLCAFGHVPSLRNRPATTCWARFSPARNRMVAPPGYYFVLFFLTFWPASLLAGLATHTVWRARAEAPVKFLLAWLVPTWIVFELVITKLPHYVLPLYPAIAILLAGCIDTHRLSRTRWMEYGTFWWFAVPALAAVIGVALTLRYEGDFGWRAWPLLAASVVFGLRAWWLYDVDGAERSMLRACAASILLAMANVLGRDPVADLAVSERCGGARRARIGMPVAAGRGGGLQRAEPGIPARHRHAAHRCGRRRQFPDARALPLRRHRVAAGPAIRAPRGNPRSALRQGHALQRLFDRQRIAHGLHDLQFAGSDR